MSMEFTPVREFKLIDKEIDLAAEGLSALISDYPLTTEKLQRVEKLIEQLARHTEGTDNSEEQGS